MIRQANLAHLVESMGSRSNKEASRVRGSSSPGSPGLGGAIKDAVGAIQSYRRSSPMSSPAAARSAADKMGGMAGKAAERLSGRKRQLDKAIEDAGG